MQPIASPDLSVSLGLFSVHSMLCGCSGLRINTPPPIDNSLSIGRHLAEHLATFGQGLQGIARATGRSIGRSGAARVTLGLLLDIKAIESLYISIC